MGKKKRKQNNNWVATPLHWQMLSPANGEERELTFIVMCSYQYH